MSLETEPAVRTPNPILAALGRALEGVLNRALALDPDTRADLGPLDGRAVTIELKGGGLAMRVLVDRDRLKIGPAFEGPSALRVATTPASLISLALRRGSGPLAPGSVEIAGDADLARRLEKLVTTFKPDIDEAFARVFGDVVGFQLARAFRGAFAWSRETAGSFARDGAEYLSEESRDIVAKGELDAFHDDVDTLRDRVDRLHARVRRLAETATGPSR